MFHILISELLDIIMQELECSLISLQRISQVIFFNLLLGVFQELGESLRARLALQVLRLNQFVKCLLYLFLRIIDLQLVHNPYQH